MKNTAHMRQRGATVLLSSAMLTVGLLFAAQQLQSKTSRNLNSVTDQIRIEQAVQLELAGRNYIKALQYQDNVLRDVPSGRSLLVQAIGRPMGKDGKQILLNQCENFTKELLPNEPFTDDRMVGGAINPPGFTPLGLTNDQGKLSVFMVAAPTETLCSTGGLLGILNPAVTLLQQLIGTDLRKTRQKFLSVAQIGCPSVGAQGTVNTSQKETLTANCITRSSKLHVDR